HRGEHGPGDQCVRDRPHAHVVSEECERPVGKARQIAHCFGLPDLEVSPGGGPSACLLTPATQLNAAYPNWLPGNFWQGWHVVGAGAVLIPLPTSSDAHVAPDADRRP